MLDSVRVRLTLWYTLVLAGVLVCLAATTYFLYRHDAAQRTDSGITELTDAFLTTLNAELADENGPDALKNAAREAMLEHRFRNTYFVLVDDAGNVLLSSLDLAVAGNYRQSLTTGFFSTEAFRSFQKAALDSGRLCTVHWRRDNLRGLARHITVGGRTYAVAVLQSLHSQNEMMADIRDTFLWAIPVALLLASMGGYFLARKSLAPIADMAAQARSMSAANLNSRLPVTNERDELGQLAQTFNQLLQRLEASFEQQRRFMADASHELRTPVAILRGEAEVTLSKAERSPEEYRQTLSTLREESQRLAHIIEDLFTLARADAGQYPLTMREAYLDEIASGALQRARSLALAKNITLVPAIESDLPICADEALLGRMLLNLLDNAIKYSPDGSTVTLTCRREGSSCVLSVSDNGPGIAIEMQPRIFERFFRGDKARSRGEGETGGAGLGLSIARWIAEAHQGQLTLTRCDGSGSTFTAIFPAGQPKYLADH
jgi:two-component system, OmpR family, sensor kinase